MSSSPGWWPADSREPSSQGPSDEGVCTTSTTSRCTRRSANRTTAIVVCASIGRMVERVMILDAVLGDRRCWWLSPEADKRAFFDVTRETGLRPEDYPHIAFGQAPRKTVRCFPDKLPIGIEKEDTSRFVFLYLVNRRDPGGLPPVPDPSPRPAAPRCTRGRFGCSCRGASGRPWRSTRPPSEKSSGPR